MPQTSAAKKALRVSDRRRVINDRWRRQLRESLHDMTNALKGGDAKVAQEAFVKTQKMIDRAAKHNILNSRTAARKKSRLQQAVTKLAK
jgi:ribosomal protein S20